MKKRPSDLEQMASSSILNLELAMDVVENCQIVELFGGEVTKKDCLLANMREAIGTITELSRYVTAFDEKRQMAAEY